MYLVTWNNCEIVEKQIILLRMAETTPISDHTTTGEARFNTDEGGLSDLSGEKLPFLTITHYKMCTTLAQRCDGDG